MENYLKFSKTKSLQREPFLTVFYTINLSPLLVTKRCFMLIEIFEKLPVVSTAFNVLYYPLPRRKIDNQGHTLYTSDPTCLFLFISTPVEDILFKQRNNFMDVINFDVALSTKSSTDVVVVALHNLKHTWIHNFILRKIYQRLPSIDLFN